MNHRASLRLTTGLVLTLLFLSACGATATIPPTDTPTSVPPTFAPTLKSTFPTGKFTAKDGDWVLTFDDNGNYTFSDHGKVEASGTFSIQANEVTWETDSYCDLRGGGKSTYTWTFEDVTLLFRLKGEDKCSDRVDTLDNVPYHKEY